MSITAARPAATEVEHWLERFDSALQAGDATAAADLFATESYWRDLVAFTWNIRTVEGREGVAHMLSSALAHTRPRGWEVTEEPTTTDGVTEAWIAFETEVGRGHGLVRLIDGKAWTLLTALEELKGHEETLGGRRPKGVEHGADPERHTWLENRRREAAQLGYTSQPYVVVVGGGQGGIALGARLRVLGVPAIIASATPARVTRGATATRRCACTTRSGTTTCPTSSSPPTGRCSRPRTRWRTGWRCTRG